KFVALRNVLAADEEVRAVAAIDNLVARGYADGHIHPRGGSVAADLARRRDARFDVDLLRTVHVETNDARLTHRGRWGLHRCGGRGISGSCFSWLNGAGGRYRELAALHVANLRPRDDARLLLSGLDDFDADARLR